MLSGAVSFLYNSWYSLFYMRVILLKDVRKIGQHGEVKDVSEGYANNYLFPQKLAEPATDEKLAQHAAKIAAHEAEVAKLEEQLAKKIQMLHGKKITITARATEKGGLFKSITEKDIVKAVRGEHSLEIPESAITSAIHIKTLGEHTLGLKSKTAKADLTVAIVAA